MVHETYEAEVATGGAGRQVGRLLATLVGVALLVVGAFLNWTPDRTGDELTVKALVQPNFGGESDIVRTVGGLTILIALVALAGLVDRTGWLTRLAGAAALVVFVMFAIQAYRFFGHDFNSAVHDVRVGGWLLLVGGVVLLVGGFLGARVVRVPAEVEDPGHLVREGIRQ
ncbi:MAG TPA: sugar:proton symporter [Actinospica sp.]|nr:sugar:proton symporter [Actinospica sp.]